jgi:hypothetical protein
LSGTTELQDQPCTDPSGFTLAVAVVVVPQDPAAAVHVCSANEDCYIEVEGDFENTQIKIKSAPEGGSGNPSCADAVSPPIDMRPDSANYQQPLSGIATGAIFGTLEAGNTRWYLGHISAMGVTSWGPPESSGLFICWCGEATSSPCSDHRNYIGHLDISGPIPERNSFACVLGEYCQVPPLNASVVGYESFQLDKAYQTDSYMSDIAFSMVRPSAFAYPRSKFQASQRLAR